MSCRSTSLSEPAPQKARDHTHTQVCVQTFCTRLPGSVAGTQLANTNTDSSPLPWEMTGKYLSTTLESPGSICSSHHPGVWPGRIALLTHDNSQSKSGSSTALLLLLILCAAVHPVAPRASLDDIVLLSFPSPLQKLPALHLLPQHLPCIDLHNEIMVWSQAS